MGDFFNYSLVFQNDPNTFALEIFGHPYKRPWNSRCLGVGIPILTFGMTGRPGIQLVNSTGELAPGFLGFNHRFPFDISNHQTFFRDNGRYLLTVIEDVWILGKTSTPLEDTPKNPLSQLWKESRLIAILVKGLGMCSSSVWCNNLRLNHRTRFCRLDLRPLHRTNDGYPGPGANGAGFDGAEKNSENVSIQWWSFGTLTYRMSCWNWSIFFAAIWLLLDLCSVYHPLPVFQSYRDR